jgi:hypothetical protein
MSDKKKFSETAFGQFLSKAAKVVPDALEAAAEFKDNPVESVRMFGRILKGADSSNPEIENLTMEFEANRHKWEMEMKEFDLKVFKAETDDRKRATENYVHSKKMTNTLALEIMKKNLPYVGILVLVNCAVVLLAKSTDMDLALVAVASNFIGMVINSLLNERRTVLEFFMGGSMGEQDKGQFLQDNLKRA